MRTKQRSRVPAGVPTGGRFAPTARPEADIQLDAAPAVLRQRSSDDMAGLKAGIAERRRELDHAVNDFDRARLLTEITRRQERLLALVERSTGGTRDGGMEGSFGSVTVMPRAPESGPGTLILVETSGQTDGEPVVVMINDEVIHVPVESRDVLADDELGELDAALQRRLVALRSGDASAEEDVQRLSARCAALAAVREDPDCRYLELDWGEDGLVAVGSRDAFLDPGPAPDGIGLYTTNLRPANEACDGILTRQDGGRYRMDIDAALGRPAF